MMKAEVEIGGKYYANVTNKRVEIQIDAEKATGGWNATNLTTGKKIHIKSAQRLLGVVGSRKGKSKVTTEGNEAVADSEPAPAETIVDDSTAAAVSKKPRKAKPSDGDKKLSCVAAALKVLGEASEPLNTKEMIEAMESKGYWTSPGGKTPHATLYSAILRELSKGDESPFVKTERGRFTVQG